MVVVQQILTFIHVFLVLAYPATVYNNTIVAGVLSLRFIITSFI